MNITQINYNDIKPEQWAGGLTYQYFIYPQTCNYANKDFLFRLSSAQIFELKPFTNFIGYKRYFTMLDNDLDLTINGKKHTGQPLDIISFTSEDDVKSATLGQDFNLMVAQDIKDSSFAIEQGFITCSVDFILIIAIKAQKIYVNNKEYSLLEKDALIIDNTERSEIDIISSKPLLIGKITLPYRLN